ncbi:MAG TPA: ankyrin repeat domain-containing protein, partial [Azospira sp.]|nr:ankyrin repeat domain-containing protein [Azospira sp.]
MKYAAPSAPLGGFSRTLVLALALAWGPAPAQEVKPFQPPGPVRYGLALEMGNLAQAREWLEAGLPPDYLADRVGTGLMIGAWEGNLPLMELFLARGADINAVNGKGEQALLLAAWKGQLAAVKWLVEHGAAVNREGLQWSALHYAVFAGNQEVADYLLQQGAEVNARAPNGSSVLMMAAYEGKEALAIHLMERGADPQIRNENGHTALDWAMKYDHLKVARVITNPEEFFDAANRPKADWGESRRSAKEPEEIQRLLEVRRTMAAKGYDLARIDQRISAARARYARLPPGGRDLPPAVGLEISASRANPQVQKARLLTPPAAKGGKGAPAR